MASQQMKWGEATPETARKYGATNKPQAAAGALLTSMMGIEEGDRVLVLGCGTGDDVVSIAQLIGPGGQVFAQDLDDNSIAIAREKVAALPRDISGIVHLYVGDARNLAVFYDTGINKIHANAFIHWILERQDFYHEIAKVAEPDAVLGLCSGDGDTRNAMSFARERVFKEQGCDPSGFVSWPTSDEFHQQLPIAGFDDPKVTSKLSSHGFKDAEALMEWFDVSSGRRWHHGLKDKAKGRERMLQIIEEDFMVKLKQEDGTIVRAAVFQTHRIYAIARFGK